MIIKILGTGCPNCIKLENNVKLALEKIGIKAEVQKVTDIETMMSYNIMSTPGLVLDEKVIGIGKNLDIDTIIKLLQGENIKEDKTVNKGKCCCGGKC